MSRALLPSLALAGAALLGTPALGQQRPTPAPSARPSPSPTARPSPSPTKPKEDPRARARTLVTRLVRDAKLTPSQRGQIWRELYTLGEACGEALVPYWDQFGEGESDRVMMMIAQAHASRRALDAVLKACDSEVAFQRRSAAAVLCEFMAPEQVAVTTPVLLRLAQDEDWHVADHAIGSLGAIVDPETWRPLLEILAAEVSGPRKDKARIDVLGRALAHYLEAQALPSRVRDVFAVASRALETDPDLGPTVSRMITGVLSNSRSTVALPFFRRILLECYAAKSDDPVVDPVIEARRAKQEEEGVLVPPPAPGEDLDNLLEEVFGPDGFAEALRPFTAELRIAALKGIGLAKDTDSFPLVVLALRDPIGPVRENALRVVWFTLPPSDLDAERKMLSEVVNLLVDPVAGIRTRAYEMLTRKTKTKLPFSYNAWKQWVDQHLESQSDMARLLVLAQRSGFETVEAFLEHEGFKTVDELLKDYDFPTLRAYLDANLPAEEKEGQ